MDLSLATLSHHVFVKGPIARTCAAAAEIAGHVGDQAPVVVCDVAAAGWDRAAELGRTSRAKGVIVVVLAEEDAPFRVAQNMGTTIDLS